MKKILLTTLAAGALLAGGAVHADDPWAAAYNHIVGSGVWQANNGVAPRAASGLYRDDRGTFYYDIYGQKVYQQGSAYVPPSGYSNAYPYNNGVPFAYGQLPRGLDRDRDGVRDRYDRDRDNDGVRNRYDRDRDGDGVRNDRDRHPNNPRRR